MSYDLYHSRPSAASRSVVMLAKELGIELNLKPLNLLEKEHLTPEFLAINPQHTVPTLVDNDADGFVLWESRAILRYLVDKVSPGHTLFPTDLKERATVNRWLDYDAGTLWPHVYALLSPMFLKGEGINEEKVAALKEKLVHLDAALEGKTYITGENRTIADLAILASLTMMSVIENCPDMELENIRMWWENLRSVLPDYKETNEDCMEPVKEYLKSKQA